MIEKNIKILIVGAGNYYIYEKAIYDAFMDLGYNDVKIFAWKEYLEEEQRGGLSTFLTRIQNKFEIGPKIDKINNKLLEICQKEKPDLVFVYSGILIYGKTIKRIKKKTDAIVFYYNNDDPFADYYPLHHWRHYRKALHYSDFDFVYRKKNCKDIFKKYHKHAEVLLPYYIDKKNYPIDKTEIIPKTPEVVFLGHYEDDERCEFISALAKKGIKVGVPKEHFSKFKKQSDNVIPIENSMTDYNRYLGSCKIPLIFFSKINHDTYTRRCFEIPAAGAFILSPYTEDMSKMFEEGKEAVFFHDKEEFVNKVCYYLANDEEREEIAKNGRRRLLQDGHDIKDRALQILQVFEKVREEGRNNFVNLIEQ